jgi:hypothetical protein
VVKTKRVGRGELERRGEERRGEEERTNPFFDFVILGFLEEHLQKEKK